MNVLKKRNIQENLKDNLERNAIAQTLELQRGIRITQGYTRPYFSTAYSKIAAVQELAGMARVPRFRVLPFKLSRSQGRGPVPYLEL